MSSSRLPGKALMEISGKKIIQYIFERLEQVVEKSQIILATSRLESDDVLSDFCNDYGVSVYRGDLDNVAKRFYDAASENNWDYAIRINGDNIFVDVSLLREIVALSLEGRKKFISNVKGRTFPKGMSIESVYLPHFKAILPKIVNSQKYSEHVTLYMYENELFEDYYFVVNDRFPILAAMQMAVDTKADFVKVSEIIKSFNRDHFTYGLEEFSTLLRD